jgi:uncharacterized protein
MEVDPAGDSPCGLTQNLHTRLHDPYRAERDPRDVIRSSRLVTVAALGDTHLPRGGRALPPECVTRLRSADLILHTGDHSSLAAYEELCAFGPPVEAVHGNVDEPALRALLPAARVVDVAGLCLALTHDAGRRQGREDRLRARFPGCAAVLYGHSHVPQVELHDGVWILNPGSPTERRRSPTHTMLELRIANGSIAPTLVTLGLRRT